MNSANQSTAGSKVSNRDLFLLSQFSDFLVDDSVSGLLESHQLNIMLVSAATGMEGVLCLRSKVKYIPCIFRSQSNWHVFAWWQRLWPYRYQRRFRSCWQQPMPELILVLSIECNNNVPSKYIFTVLWKLTDLFDSAGSCTPADLDFQIGQSDVLDVDFESATVAIIAQKSKFIRFENRAT